MGDFREVKSGFYFPFAASGEAKYGGKSFLYKRTTEKLEFPESFDDGLFTFEFPAGTHVYDAFIDDEYTVGRVEGVKPPVEGLVGEEDEQLAAAPERASSSGETLSVQPTAEPAQERPQEKSRTAGRTVALFLAGAIIVVVAIAVWRRRGRI